MTVARRSLILFAKVLISAFLLYAVFNRINLSQVALTIASANLFLILACIVLLYVAWTIAARKWQVLLPHDLRLPLAQCLKYIYITASYSALLPGGQLVGEIGKFGHAQNRFTHKTGLITSILIDKILGISAMVGLGLLAVLVDQSAPPIFFMLYVLLSIGAALCVSILMLSRLTGLAAKIPRPLSLTSSLVLATAYQLTNGLIVWLLGLSVGIHVAFVTMVWITTAVSLLVAIPITYGGFGIREVSFASLLSLYSIPQTRAVSLALLIGALLLVGSLPGIYFIFKDLSRRRLWL